MSSDGVSSRMKPWVSQPCRPTTSYFTDRPLSLAPFQCPALTYQSIFPDHLARPMLHSDADVRLPSLVLKPVAVRLSDVYTGMPLTLADMPRHFGPALMPVAMDIGGYRLFNEKENAIYNSIIQHSRALRMSAAYKSELTPMLGTQKDLKLSSALQMSSMFHDFRFPKITSKEGSRELNFPSQASPEFYKLQSLQALELSRLLNSQTDWRKSRQIAEHDVTSSSEKNDMESTETEEEASSNTSNFSPSVPKVKTHKLSVTKYRKNFLSPGSKVKKLMKRKKTFCDDVDSNAKMVKKDSTSMVSSTSDEENEKADKNGNDENKHGVLFQETQNPEATGNSDFNTTEDESSTSQGENTLKESSSSFGDRKSFRCPQCRYLTDRKNNLKRHIVTMHQESTKTLECCGLAFQSKALLRDHNAVFHKGGYRCQICSRNFCRKALLRRHLTVHSGQKDYFCDLCGYATSHKSNLERHQKVHNKKEANNKTSSKLDTSSKGKGHNLNIFSTNIENNFFNSRNFFLNKDFPLSASHVSTESSHKRDFADETGQMFTNKLMNTFYGRSFKSTRKNPNLSRFLFKEKPNHNKEIQYIPKKKTSLFKRSANINCNVAFPEISINTIEPNFNFSTPASEFPKTSSSYETLTVVEDDQISSSNQSGNNSPIDSEKSGSYPYFQDCKLRLNNSAFSVPIVTV